MGKQIGIYGSGTIGACQATLTSGNGYPTVVVGHSKAGLIRCRETICQNWDDLIAEGLATEANKKAAMALVTITNDPTSLVGSCIVFEAVAEDADVKEAVYHQVTEHCGRDVIVASTTSSIDASLLAERIENSSRFLIAHPFQPVHMLPLVEVVRHKTDFRRNHKNRLYATERPESSGCGSESKRPWLLGKSVCAGAIPGIHLPH